MAVKKYYQAVTNDIYELPITLPMSADELAEYLGLKRESVVWAGSPSAQKKRERRKKYQRRKNRKRYLTIGYYIDFDEEET